MFALTIIAAIMVANTKPQSVVTDCIVDHWGGWAGAPYVNKLPNETDVRFFLGGGMTMGVIVTNTNVEFDRNPRKWMKRTAECM